MLQWIRNIGQSKLGKLFTTLLFGLIIGGFALFGVSDVFRGAPPTVVASVGKSEITRFDFQRAIENFMTTRAREKQPITRTAIKERGLDKTLWDELVSDTLVKEAARELQIGAPQQAVSQYILNEPIFQTNGVFEKERFDAIIQNWGYYSEEQYIARMQQLIPGQQIYSVFDADTSVPRAKQELLWRLDNEKRTVRAFTLPYDENLIPAEDDETLKAFYEKNKSRYSTREQRTVAVLSIDPTSVAKNVTVPDSDVRAEYERTKDSMATSESRAFEQIIFTSTNQAKEAKAELDKGTPFDTVVAEYKAKDGVTIVPPSSPIARESIAMLDPELANTLFSLELNAVSGVFQSLLGPSIARVTQITPPEPPPFEAVALDIRRTLAAQRASNALDEVHDKVEDLLGEEKPLIDIGKELDIPVVMLTNINADGKDPAGEDLAAPIIKQVPSLNPGFLNQVFHLELNRDGGAQRTEEGGYLWFVVTAVTPAGEKPFETIRSDVLADWRHDTLITATSEKAAGYVERLKNGEDMAAVISELGADEKTITDITRSKAPDDIPPSGIAGVFSTGVGGFGTTLTNAGVLIYRIVKAEVPEFKPEAEPATKLAEAQAEDERAQFLAQLRREIPIETNQILYNQVAGGDDYQ
ncbi:MAG: SurA N-terminal domain-containing protein [Methylobacteriaceae bacterium]|nr:SurA N-terminal domain-containing protein [Methylobacteriaceae bacterium]